MTKPVVKFAMADIETLGVEVDDPIIEIGLCVVSVVDEEVIYTTTSQTVYVDLDPKNMMKHQRETLGWHQKTLAGAELIKEVGIAKPQSANVRTALSDCIKRTKKTLPAKLPWYARGPQFDFVMMERHIPESLRPWRFFMLRDARTLDVTLGRDVATGITGPTPHRAGLDAERQARRVVEIFTQHFPDSFADWPE